jgi:hypothetical protein
MHPSTLFRLVEEHGRPPPYTWPAALTASEDSRYAPARRQQAIISIPRADPRGSIDQQSGSYYVPRRWQ